MAEQPHTYELTRRLEFSGDPESVVSRKTARSLVEVNTLIYEFIREFGTPDEGEQTITITLKSSP